MNIIEAASNKLDDLSAAIELDDKNLSKKIVVEFEALLINAERVTRKAEANIVKMLDKAKRVKS